MHAFVEIIMCTVSGLVIPSDVLVIRTYVWFRLWRGTGAAITAQCTAVKDGVGRRVHNQRSQLAILFYSIALVWLETADGAKETIVL